MGGGLEHQGRGRRAGGPGPGAQTAGGGAGGPGARAAAGGAGGPGAWGADGGRRRR